MTDYILSIDPGLSTGIALIGYETDQAPTLVGAWQFSGGVVGLLNWVETHHRGSWYDDEWVDVTRNRKNVTIIAEKFTARNTRGFSYTTASLEPLRCEGALIALGLMPDYTPKEKRWMDPGVQYLVGGKDLAAKRSRQHGFLQDSGFYRTNRDFPDSPAKDKADDFRSAAAHGLAYLAREVGNKPAFSMIADWVESHGG